jgi:hypothetical protein
MLSKLLRSSWIAGPSPTPKPSTRSASDLLADVVVADDVEVR